MFSGNAAFRQWTSSLEKFFSHLFFFFNKQKTKDHLLEVKIETYKKQYFHLKDDFAYIEVSRSSQGTLWDKILRRLLRFYGKLAYNVTVDSSHFCFLFWGEKKKQRKNL